MKKTKTPKRQLLSVAGILAVLAMATFAQVKLLAVNGYIPDGQETSVVLNDFNCGPNDVCNGSCSWKQIVTYKCKLGLGDCTTTTQTLSTWAGDCDEDWFGTSCHCDDPAH
jgi:hypothetical protein